MTTPQLLALIGVVQGLFLFFAILSRGWRKAVNYSLAALALLLASRLLPGVLAPMADEAVAGRYEPVLHSFVFLFGPLLWVYIQNLTGTTVPKRVVAHLIPFAIVFAVSLIAPSNIRKTMFAVTGAVAYLHIGAYVLAMLFMLRRFARTAKNYVSNPERVELIWLRALLIASLALLLASFFNDLVLAFSWTPQNTEWLPYLAADAFLFVIAYLAIRHPEADPDVREVSASIAGDEARSDDERRYSRNRLGDETERSILESITDHMAKNESYRNDGLKLSDLANAIGHSSHTISMVLNIHRRETFYQFVNCYRVEAAKRELVDPASYSRSILDISLNSGFRSKSTFNRVFRELTGKTPSEFRSS